MNVSPHVTWTEISDDVFVGRVGTLNLFRIERTVGDRPWHLTTRLPIAFAYSGGPTVDHAKAVAEKVTAAFAAAIGATFPE